MPSFSVPRRPGSRSRTSQRFALTAAAVALALAAVGCGGAAASLAPSATPTASPTTAPTPTAIPTASPTASPTETPEATESPDATASQATTGRIVVNGQGFAITLPTGWTSLPVDPAALASYIEALPADSQLRSILQGQSGSVAQQAIKFLAFDVRPDDVAGGFARNLNVIVQPASTLSLSVIEQAAKASLESVDAIRKPVTTKVVTLPVGQALRIDYLLDIATAAGKSAVVAGTQYYLQLPTSTLIVSFSTDQASAKKAAVDFDAIAKSIEAAP